MPKTQQVLVTLYMKDSLNVGVNTLFESQGRTQMKLKGIDVSNFGSVKNSHLEDIPEVLLVVGANSSARSSLAQCLSCRGLGSNGGHPFLTWI